MNEKLFEGIANDLLTELDRVAREVCHYDYGLPLSNDEAMP